MDFTTSYAEILKYDKNDDGTLTVYGKATSDDLDIDQQICDNDWLGRAMPEWFKSGGNIREQHSSIAAGVATEYEEKGDGYYVTAKVVDPVSIKKVEHKVLKGFSIGIKGPRIVRDNKAANGRIVDGQIVEVSLVDRPANPTCQLVLAKSVGGESTLTQVEELKYSDSQERDEHGRFGGGGGNSSAEGNSAHSDALIAIHDKIEQTQTSHYLNPKNDLGDRMDVGQQREDAENWIESAHDSLEAGNNQAAAENIRGAADALQSSVYGSHASALRDLADTIAGSGKSLTPTTKETPVAKSALVETILEMHKSATGDTVKFDQAAYDTARRALAELIIVEANEMANGSDERDSIEELIDALKHLFHWYEGETKEGETSASIELSAEADEAKGDSCECDCDSCKDSKGCDSKTCKCAMAKSITTDKCLECGCHKAEDSHGRTDVTTAEIVEAPKSAEADEVPVETPAEEAETPAEEVSAPENLDDAEVSAIVEKAVQSASESVKAEIAELRAAKMAAEEKSVALESELVLAKSAAVAGGPKRTGRTAVTQENELLIKAASYRAKAAATSDPTLVKGYSALAKEYAAKAGLSTPDED
jgi:hypothetical protein